MNVEVYGENYKSKREEEMRARSQDSVEISDGSIENVQTSMMDKADEIFVQEMKK